MEGDNRMDDKLEQMQSGPAPENAPPEGTPAPVGLSHLSPPPPAIMGLPVGAREIKKK